MACCPSATHASLGVGHHGRRGRSERQRCLLTLAGPSQLAPHTSVTAPPTSPPSSASPMPTTQAARLEEAEEGARLEDLVQEGGGEEEEEEEGGAAVEGTGIPAPKQRRPRLGDLEDALHKLRTRWHEMPEGGKQQLVSDIHTLHASHQPLMEEWSPSPSPSPSPPPQPPPHQAPPHPLPEFSHSQGIGRPKNSQPPFPSIKKGEELLEQRALLAQGATVMCLGSQANKSPPAEKNVRGQGPPKARRPTSRSLPSPTTM